MSTFAFIACSIVDDPATASLFSDHGYALHLLAWVDETLTIRHGPLNMEAFVHEMNARRLPYTHSDGHEQHIHVYLLIDESVDEHALFMHGSHAIMDARPTLRTLDVLLGWISSPPTVPLDALAWGTEWKNLPAGPITATGGPSDTWSTKGVELVQEVGQALMNPVVSEPRAFGIVSSHDFFSRIQRLVSILSVTRSKS